MRLASPPRLNLLERFFPSHMQMGNCHLRKQAEAYKQLLSQNLTNLFLGKWHKAMNN